MQGLTADDFTADAFDIDTEETERPTGQAPPPPVEVAEEEEGGESDILLTQLENAEESEEEEDRQEEVEDTADALLEMQLINDLLLPAYPPQIHIYSYTSTLTTSHHALLSSLKPTFVIMIDPDATFIRQLEVFKAEQQGRKLRVYFMMYHESVEEQVYLSLIRREKEGFERAIREKSVMVIPEEMEGKKVAEDPEEAFLRSLNPRNPGASRLLKDNPPMIIVDVREFRSSLPSILHEKGFVVKPVTIEVGDYILTPSLCVERKSMVDLIGSLNSGRLYTQAEAMSTHYETPVLLIEFDQDKSFALQSLATITSEISSTAVSSKLVLLTIHFPKLRIIWSSSPHQTAAIFDDLKRNAEEPDVDTALSVGNLNLTSSDGKPIELNPMAQDILLAMPGINHRNVRRVMTGCRDFLTLTQMSQEEISDLLGNTEQGRSVYEFKHADKRGASGKIVDQNWQMQTKQTTKRKNSTKKKKSTNKDRRPTLPQRSS